MVVPYFQTNGEGMYCFPIDIAMSGVSGIQDGANVTIQVIYDGGDDVLYQVGFALRFLTRSQD
jgi:hypothetical protein